MLLQEKMQNAMRISHEKSLARQQFLRDAERNGSCKKDMMEKGDLPAMVISAFLVIFPVVVIALLGIACACKILL